MSVDIARMVAHLPPPQGDAVQRAYHERAENETAAFLYCFFLGIFGVHRFYLHQWLGGLIRLLLPALAVAAVAVVLTLGLDTTLIVVTAGPLLLIALIWALIDLFRIDGQVAARNLKLAERLIADTMLADPTAERKAAAKLDSIVHETAMRADAGTRSEARDTERQSSLVAAQESSTLSAAMGASAGAAIVAGNERATGTYAQTEAHYDATTLTQISAEPEDAASVPQASSTPLIESVTETMHSDEIPTGSDAADVLSGATGSALVGTAAAAGATEDESITRTKTHEGYSRSESVESYHTVHTVSDAHAWNPVVEEPQDAPAGSVGDEPAAGEPETLAEVVAGLSTPAPIWPGAGTEIDMAADDTGNMFGITQQTRPDVTDMGVSALDAPPVADITTGRAMPISITLPDDTMPSAQAAELPVQPAPEQRESAEEALLVLTPLADDMLPMEAPPAPAYPIFQQSEPYSLPADPSVASTASEESLAELAPYSDAGSMPTMPESNVIDSDEIEHATHHALKRIRVVRQVRTNGQVVEEDALEEYIEVDADPEPVKARLREQLRMRAEGHAHDGTMQV